MTKVRGGVVSLYARYAEDDNDLEHLLCLFCLFVVSGPSVGNLILNYQVCG